MSSSSKLSFQSRDGPSARRKSWQGFHGLMLWILERSRERNPFPTPYSNLLAFPAFLQSGSASLSRKASMFISNRPPLHAEKASSTITARSLPHTSTAKSGYTHADLESAMALKQSSDCIREFLYCLGTASGEIC